MEGKLKSLKFNFSRPFLIILFLALPVHLNYDSIIIDLCEIENVRKAHSLHIWCLTMEKFALSVHLVAESNVDNRRKSVLIHSPINFPILELILIKANSFI